MLSKYFEQLQKLSELLSHGKDLDLNLWKETICLTALIIVQSIGFLVALVVIVCAPIVIYRRLFVKLNNKMKNATTNEQAEQIAKKWFWTKVVYWSCLIVLYVPFMIPTLLLLL